LTIRTDVTIQSPTLVGERDFDRRLRVERHTPFNSRSFP
jgi:hypothetical protein